MKYVLLGCQSTSNDRHGSLILAAENKHWQGKPFAIIIVVTLVLWSIELPIGKAESPAKQHAMAMHGIPKYPPNFKNFDYVRPDVPKGGVLRLAVIGSFDSLNPYIIRGVPAQGHNLVFESLLARSFDEPFSLYGNIAESIEVSPDRSWIIFNLDSRAKFHDGNPITVDDVLFSWRILKTRGKPNMRSYYSKVVSTEKLADRRVKFVFKGEHNWELPLILGLMPVLSERFYSNLAFDESTLNPPVGSGPYRVAEVDPGRSITYRRDPDYWGANLPVNMGRYNFDVVRYDYYRDADVALEAFKAGEYDLRFEPDAGRWVTGYDHPAVKEGRIRREAIAHQRPVGMMAVVFNTRRPMFRDSRVRLALNYAFDFEWLNRVLYHGVYSRTRSYFEHSELAASQSISPQEVALLEEYRSELPKEVFNTVYQPPKAEGSGKLRRNLRYALGLFKAAGWKIKAGNLVETDSDRLMEFEILLVKPWHERLLLPFVRNLKRLGVKVRLRTVDSPQYENRTASFDFDAIVYHWGQSLSPGNEQEIYWGSRAADTEGSRNYAGIKDPVVDELVARIAGSRDRERLVIAARALDRVLLWGHYVIPLFHSKTDKVAYWSHLHRPQVTPLYGTTIDLWWEEGISVRDE